MALALSFDSKVFVLRDKYIELLPFRNNTKAKNDDIPENTAFGASIDINEAGNLIVIGAPEYKVSPVLKSHGAAYLFHLDIAKKEKESSTSSSSSSTSYTTSIQIVNRNKLEPNPASSEEEIQISSGDYYGWSVSVDKHVVVGSRNGNYFCVFSLLKDVDVEFHSCITCIECSHFGEKVSTYGDTIAVTGRHYTGFKTFVYSLTSQRQEQEQEEEEEGKEITWSLKKMIPVKRFEIEFDVVMSDNVIATTDFDINNHQSVISVFKNDNHDNYYPLISRIPVNGDNRFDTFGDFIIIGDPNHNHDEKGRGGSAYLYYTNGTLIQTLNATDAEQTKNNNINDDDFDEDEGRSFFGNDVSISRDKLILGSPGKVGKAYIYSISSRVTFERNVKSPKDNNKDNTDMDVGNTNKQNSDPFFGTNVAVSSLKHHQQQPHQEETYYYVVRSSFNSVNIVYESLDEEEITSGSSESSGQQQDSTSLNNNPASSSSSSSDVLSLSMKVKYNIILFSGSIVLFFLFE